MPFLDKEFLDVAMRLNPAVKMCPGHTIEKRIVRDAFASLLPESVAWRQKEQFSDGVGYSWIDTLKAITAAAVSDEEMQHAAERFPINPPQNKEEYYYRCIFEEHFPSASAAKSVTECTKCRMFYSRSTGMGRKFQKPERSEWPRSSRSTRGCLLKKQ